MMVILLTKTPHSERTRLCLRLLAGLTGSVDAMVYLAGDGVYNLLCQDEPNCISQRPRCLSKPLSALVHMNRIMACREDLAARGVCADGKATVPVDFFGMLVDNMMEGGNRIYIF